MLSVTNRQTDGRHDDANSRAYCVAVRSANNVPQIRRYSLPFHTLIDTWSFAWQCTCDMAWPDCSVLENEYIRIRSAYSEPMTSHALGDLAGSRRTLQQRVACESHGSKYDVISKIRLSDPLNQASKHVAFIKRVSIAHRCTIERVHDIKCIKYTKKFIQSHDDT